jgi:predicted ATPase
MPPYWPWVQAIRSYVRERDVEALRAEMGVSAADISEIVPEVKERLPDLKPAPQVDNLEHARFRRFDSITTFLKNAAQNQPLVLILDNLHGADQPSLLMLEFLAHELTGSRLLIVGAYRDLELIRQHPLSETLGELTRERLAQRLPLHGLSPEDVSSYVAGVTGITLLPGLVSALHTQTEGNPCSLLKWCDCWPRKGS